MDNQKNGEGSCTLEEFECWSKAVAKLFRALGVSSAVDDNLLGVAFFGPNPNSYINDWADRIVALNATHGSAQPVSVRPWKVDLDAITVPKGARGRKLIADARLLNECERTDKCATSCAAWVLRELWGAIYPENPLFEEFSAEFIEYCEADYVNMKSRLEHRETILNCNELRNLAAKMEVERILLVAADKLKCPRVKWPKDPMTRDLIVALDEGTAAGESIDVINRDFMAQHDVSPSMVSSLKRAARRYREKR